MILQTVERAFTVLEMVAERSMTRKEIEIEMGLNRTTVNRLISTLTKLNYIEKSPIDNRYEIGLKLVEISSLKLNQIELKTEAAPSMRDLSTKLNQVCHMGTLVQDEVVYIEKIEPRISIRMFSSIGKRMPIHSTSLGKVLISDLSDNQILEILERKGMKSLTPNTITDPNLFLKEIQRTREVGYALDVEENEQSIYCIAVPIRDYRNQIIAAMSTSGSDKSLLDEDNGAIEQVINTGLLISKQMGFNISI